MRAQSARGAGSGALAPVWDCRHAGGAAKRPFITRCVLLNQLRSAVEPPASCSSILAQVCEKVTLIVSHCASSQRFAGPTARCIALARMRIVQGGSERKLDTVLHQNDDASPARNWTAGPGCSGWPMGLQALRPCQCELPRTHLAAVRVTRQLKFRSRVVRT